MYSNEKTTNNFVSFKFYFHFTHDNGNTMSILNDSFPFLRTITEIRVNQIDVSIDSHGQSASELRSDLISIGSMASSVAYRSLSVSCENHRKITKAQNIRTIQPELCDTTSKYQNVHEINRFNCHGTVIRHLQ